MAKRNYGYDSIQNTSERKKSSPSTKDVLKYHFDNALSKTKYFVLFLVVLSMVLGLIMTIITYFLLAEKDGISVDIWWKSFTKILGIGGGDNWGNRIINLLYWAMGIAISGSVIGYIAKSISNITEYLKKGRSKVILKDHILILGWSNNIYAVISELAKANANVKNANIVVFSSHNNQYMQDQLKLNMPADFKGNVITRSGDIKNPRDLQIANPSQAKSIVVLGNKTNDDLEVTMCVLALYTHIAGGNSSVVVQIGKKETAQNLQSISGLDIIPVFNYDILVNVCSQAIRQKGIGSVVLDFMDFEGNEIYYYAEHGLANSTYSEASMSFNNSCVIGIFNKDNKVVLNPSKDYIIQEGDKLIVVAEDDDLIKFTGNIKPTKHFTTENKIQQESNDNLMVLGWSKFGKDILTNYNSFNKNKSTIHIVYDNKYLSPNSDMITTFNDENVVFHNMEKSLNNLVNFINEHKISSVLILPYNDQISPEECDALTLLSMIELNSFNRKNSTQKIRVIAYLLDSAKVDLAAFTETEELIVSDNLSALLVAQYAENPKLLPVFEDIFDAGGTAINLEPIENIIGAEVESIVFSDLVYAGISAGKSILGVYKDMSNDHSSGIMINPPKTEIIQVSKGDKVIAIC